MHVSKRLKTVSWRPLNAGLLMGPDMVPCGLVRCPVAVAQKGVAMRETPSPLGGEGRVEEGRRSVRKQVTNAGG